MRGPVGAGRASFATERVAITSGVALVFVVGYFGIGRAVDGARAMELATPIDGWIPFRPGAVFVYASLLPGAFAPAFLIGCPRLFRRVAAAYLSVMLACFALFAILPVTSVGLRPPVPVEPAGFTDWCIALLYGVDPPLNCFPSLHLAIGFLAAVGVATFHPRLALVAAAWFVAVVSSVLVVKQHFLLDAVGGIALAALAHRLWLRSYAPPPRMPAAGISGALGFLSFVAASYALVILLYAEGFSPWPAGA